MLKKNTSLTYLGLAQNNLKEVDHLLEVLKIKILSKEEKEQ